MAQSIRASTLAMSRAINIRQQFSDSQPITN